MRSWRKWRALAAHRTPLPLMVKHAYGRCPTRTQLSTRPLVTGHIWRRNTPKVLKKWGKVIMVGSRRVFVLFLILGRRADHPMIFHIFPYLFYHRFLVSNCSKFCVKWMGSTVFTAVLNLAQSSFYRRYVVKAWLKLISASLFLAPGLCFCWVF